MKLFSFTAKALAALVACALSTSAQAELLLEYNFDRASGLPTVLNPHVMAGTFNGGPGGGFAGDWYEPEGPEGGGPREERGWYAFKNTDADTEVGAPSGSFTLGAIDGYKLQLDTLVFDAAYVTSAGHGTLGFRFVTGDVVFEKAINLTRFPNFTQYSISLAGLEVVSDTLKIFAFDANGGPGAQIHLDNVRVNGTVVAGSDPGTDPGTPVVPEPATLALVGLGAAGLSAVRLRQRRREEREAAAV